MYRLRTCDAIELSQHIIQGQHDGAAPASIIGAFLKFLNDWFWQQYIEHHIIRFDFS